MHRPPMATLFALIIKHLRSEIYEAVAFGGCITVFDCLIVTETKGPWRLSQSDELTAESCHRTSHLPTSNIAYEYNVITVVICKSSLF